MVERPRQLRSKLFLGFCGRSAHAAQIEALRKLQKKALSEADFFDRQALASKRFTSPEGAPGDANPPHEPSPADSLDLALAASSPEDSMPEESPPSSRRVPAPAASPRSSPSAVRNSGARSRPSTYVDTDSLPLAAPGSGSGQRPLSRPPHTQTTVKKTQPPLPASRRGPGHTPPQQQPNSRAKTPTPCTSKAKARPRGGAGRKI